jgi:putative oligomerization/nucleic acid binding protein
MAFDKFKNYWNMDIKNGVRGEARVQSVSVPTESGTSGNVRMWLDVYVEGWEPYRLKHHCMVKKTKHPGPGEVLPVMVDPDNKERIDILWKEVKTVDEVMSEGAPGATPGSVTINMGEPQVIDLGAAGIPAGMEDEVREALEAAQRYMGQMSGAEAPTTDDRLERLERLAKLRESGALTDAEFEAEKARLLE